MKDIKEELDILTHEQLKGLFLIAHENASYKINKLEQQVQYYKDKEDELRQYCNSRYEISKNDCVPARQLTIEHFLKILDDKEVKYDK